MFYSTFQRMKLRNFRQWLRLALFSGLNGPPARRTRCASLPEENLDSVLKMTRRKVALNETIFGQRQNSARHH
jgi:hypothetical protein